MIGYDDDDDDFFAGYLATEIDEEPEILEKKCFVDENILDFGNYSTLKVQKVIECNVRNEEHILDNSGNISEDENINIFLSPPSSEIERSASSSSTFHDVLEHVFIDEQPLSLQLTAPNYSQLLPPQLYASKAVKTNKSYLTDEDKISSEVCRLCNCSDSENSDAWLMCYGCGEAFHRKCLASMLRRVKCEMPIIYRKRLDGPNDDVSKRFTHAPWFCNDCVSCSNGSNHTQSTLGDSFVACRDCGKVSCVACYNSESLTNNTVIFENLQNYSCPECLKCVNCGLNAAAQNSEARRRKSLKPKVVLYADSSLCRPCYLSNQICATCPRCRQIYHSLPDHYDFGEAPFDPDFSLCPMVSCDECGNWTHCQCEGIGEEEYERMGSDKNSKFTCVDCRQKDESFDVDVSEYYDSLPFDDNDDRTNESVYRIGNLMLTADDRVLFNYWSFTEAWRRKTIELKQEQQLYKVKFADKTITCDSFKKLSVKFTELYRNINGVKPKAAISPARLLKFLEPTGRLKELCADLRAEIGQIEGFGSARTRSFKENSGAFVKKSTFSEIEAENKRRRQSLIGFNNGTSNTQLTGTLSNKSSSPSMSSGKMTVKHMYTQYLQRVLSDSSSFTVNVGSLGLALRPSVISGFGLFATRSYSRNSLIIEYCGEMLHGEDMVNKRDAFYNALGRRYRQSCYLFRLDELKVLDATTKGNLSRFINHSCDPNCYSRVVQIDSKKKLLIFATRPIEAGEEILYDYKFPDEEQKIACLCGSEKCRKWMN